VKVVLFCGGYGMRMRGGDTTQPKPMMTIGDRPVLWHLMRYYAHYGHTEFVLCLGYGAQAIKDFFLSYRETSSNDFVLSDAGQSVELLSSDISDWRITFADTGLETSIGERLRRVRKYLGDDDVFLANYGDVLTDAPLDVMIERFKRSAATACMLATRPQATFHVLGLDPDGRVTDLHAINDDPMWVNAGFFVLRKEIFDTIDEGSDLVGGALPKLAVNGSLLAYTHDGFWAPMDTLKERAYLEELYRSGVSPWMVWRTAPPETTVGVGVMDSLSVTVDPHQPLA
jgi:glucose-1-phosphate cytidylyltransferase